MEKLYAYYYSEKVLSSVIKWRGHSKPTKEVGSSNILISTLHIFFWIQGDMVSNHKVKEHFKYVKIKSILFFGIQNMVTVERRFDGNIRLK